MYIAISSPVEKLWRRKEPIETWRKETKIWSETEEEGVHRGATENEKSP